MKKILGNFINTWNNSTSYHLNSICLKYISDTYPLMIKIIKHETKSINPILILSNYSDLKLQTCKLKS